MDMAMRAKKILRFAKISLKMVIFDPIWRPTSKFDVIDASHHWNVESILIASRHLQCIWGCHWHCLFLTYWLLTLNWRFWNDWRHCWKDFGWRETSCHRSFLAMRLKYLHANKLNVVICTSLICLCCFLPKKRHRTKNTAFMSPITPWHCHRHWDWSMIEGNYWNWHWCPNYWPYF